MYFGIHNGLYKISRGAQKRNGFKGIFHSDMILFCVVWEISNNNEDACTVISRSGRIISLFRGE